MLFLIALRAASPCCRTHVVQRLRALLRWKLSEEYLSERCFQSLKERIERRYSHQVTHVDRIGNTPKIADQSQNESLPGMIPSQGNALCQQDQVAGYPLISSEMNLLTDVRTKKNYTAVKHLGSRRGIPPRSLHVKVILATSAIQPQWDTVHWSRSSERRVPHLHAEIGGEEPAVNPSVSSGTLGSLLQKHICWAGHLRSE